ncbi:MAG TPA: hypothetical protein VFA11_00495 [Acidimicrobiales bacterium]|nr:hypothetical protein [Acidimicrobiales bacterium]
MAGAEFMGVTNRSMVEAGHERTRRARILLALAVSVLVVALTGLGAGRPAAAVGTTPPPPNAPAPPQGVTVVPNGTMGKVAGMSIPNVDPQSSAAEVQRLHQDGINTISLFVWWWADKQDSNTVYRCNSAANGCNPTESDANLELQIAAAHQFGMNVILVPIFYCGGCEGGWRGTMQPSDPNAFFASYRQFIDHYAQLAQANGVNTLFVGSEMTSLESQTQQWHQVISEARTYFTGQVAYEENWDVLGNARFVDALDEIGVSAYFPLDDSPSPTLADILNDWNNSQASATQGHNWVGAVTHLALSTGKPILFGEVGYLSSDYAARQPFLNYYSNVNLQLQSDLYQAVLQTFESKSWWLGASWWEWYIPTQAPQNDDTRTPRGKTAEQLLFHWYAQGWRPENPTQPVVLAPNASPEGTPSRPGAAATPTRPGVARPGAPVPSRPGAAAQGARPGAPAAAAAAGQPQSRAAGGSHSLLGRGSSRVPLLIAAIALVVIIALVSSLAFGRPPPPSGPIS